MKCNCRYVTQFSVVG